MIGWLRVAAEALGLAKRLTPDRTEQERLSHEERRQKLEAQKRMDGVSLLILLTGCATVAFEPIAPPLADYAPEVQARAAEELDRLGPPCPHDVVIADCSALNRMIRDYQLLRDRVRAIEASALVDPPQS